MTRIYYITFNLIVLAMIVYFAVDSFYMIAMERFNRIGALQTGTISFPDREKYEKSQLSDFKDINNRNIFSKVRKSSSDSYMPEVENLEPTSLKISLRGTVTGDEANSVAFIEDTSKKTQELYHVGDSVQQAPIKSILHGKVVLEVDGKDEILMMDETVSSTTTDGSVSSSSLSEETSESSSSLDRTISLQRSIIDESLNNISDLISQASISAHVEDGEPDGLAITGIQSGSIFRRMGLRNGDIIKGASGNEIKTPEDLIALYDDLKSESDVSLQIMRRGEERTLNYQFSD